MYFIRVQTESEYKYIREDSYGCPVQSNKRNLVKLFETEQDAVDYARKFMLVKSHWVHEIVEIQEVVTVICKYAPNPKGGKWVLDAKPVK